MLQVILHLVFLMVMVELVWVLGPLRFPTKHIIFGLMVVIFCHLGVGIIWWWLIQTNIGPNIHYLKGGTIILVLLVMVEVVLVIEQPTLGPRRFFL